MDISPRIWYDHYTISLEQMLNIMPLSERFHLKAKIVITMILCNDQSFSKYPLGTLIMLTF